MRRRGPEKGLLQQLRRQAVVQALAQTRNETEAARILGITRHALWNMRRRWKILDHEWKLAAIEQEWRDALDKPLTVLEDKPVKLWKTRFGLVWAEISPDFAQGSDMSGFDELPR